MVVQLLTSAVKTMAFPLRLRLHYNATHAAGVIFQSSELMIYKCSPDVLELVLDEKGLDQIDIQYIETPWGRSEVKYCYFNGTLIGAILGGASDSKGYYQGLDIEFKNRVVLQLVPKLEKNEYLEFPEFEKFSDALLLFMSSCLSCNLVCEEDCDENKVEEVENSNSSILTKLNDLGNYCMGKNEICPTFVVREKI